jgi:two-component system chemotaxis response regulator CheB
MENVPTPIVIVSASTDAKEVASTFRAQEAGALAVVLRPPGIGHPEHKTAARELIRTVKMMSEIKVVRRLTRTTQPRLPAPPLAPEQVTATSGIQLVAIGASTGGPPVLLKILSLLPPELVVPILIVQHIAPGFVDGFAGWLSGASRFPVHIATHGQHLMPGHGYVAPDGFHMGVSQGPRIILSNHAPENGLRPSVAYLFRSVAQVMGPRAAGVLLTGMGRDGADELKLMKDMGALTIAQDEASSIVHGMPGEAIKLGAAMRILPPDAIGALLAGFVKTNGGGG